MGVVAIVLGIIGILIFSLAIFIIYFIFKSLQFVIQAINLYKKMIIRQDAILKVLLDVRDNTKKYDNINSVSESTTFDDDIFICEECKRNVPASAKVCPYCGAEFE